jgi:hypothetical protein
VGLFAGALLTDRLSRQRTVGRRAHLQAASGYGIPSQVAFGLAAAVLLVRNFNVFTAATATFLPYGFHYAMPVVCLGFATLIVTRWDVLPSWQKVVACLAFYRARV